MKTLRVLLLLSGGVYPLSANFILTDINLSSFNTAWGNHALLVNGGGLLGETPETAPDFKTEPFAPQFTFMRFTDAISGEMSAYGGMYLNGMLIYPGYGSSTLSWIDPFTNLPMSTMLWGGTLTCCGFTSGFVPPDLTEPVLFRVDMHIFGSMYLDVGVNGIDQFPPFVGFFDETATRYFSLTDPPTVPEPSTLTMLLFGSVAGILLARCSRDARSTKRARSGTH